jgi:hypothetical protein
VGFARLSQPMPGLRAIGAKSSLAAGGQISRRDIVA